MKCKRCAGKATVQLRSHNAAFCKPCFLFFFQRNVERSIARERMFTHDERMLVAVSGGKDSLALWDTLIELGYRTEGLYLGLGIGAYSAASQEKVERFAAARGLGVRIVPLEDEAGRARDPHGRRGDASSAVRGLRHLQAPLLRSRGARRRLRRARDRAQPRRRGGAAPRQRRCTGSCRTSPSSSRSSCRRTRGSCARCGRSTGRANTRARRTRSCAASTTSSRSARTATARPSSSTRT